jgi:hemolysin activation/secretion protein
MGVLGLATIPLCSTAQVQLTPADRLIQQEQQRLEQERRQIEAERRKRSLSGQELAAPVPSAELGGPCFTIEKVQWQGVTLVKPSELDEAAEAFLDQCLNASQLNQLLQLVNAHYFEQGFITTRAYLPQQNLQSGQLIIQIIEGVVEDASFSDGRTAPLLFPSAGSHLNLRDLEQGLEQINRLQSRQATMNLLPGSAQGQTRVQLTEKQGRAWQLSSGFNNSGQESTGENQYSLFASFDNPLGLYDYTYLSLQTDAENTDSDGKKSQSLSWHWDMPMGYWLLSLDISYFEYLSTIDGTFQSF